MCCWCASRAARWSCSLAGATREQTANAVSNAWADGGALRVYRQAPNAGTRKSWAAGDATSRGVWHALLALRAEMGYPSVLSAPTWGFYDALYRGEHFSLPQPFEAMSWRTCCSRCPIRRSFTHRRRWRRRYDCIPEVAPRLNEVARHRDRDTGSGRSHHQRSPDGWPIPPIAIIVCSTWWPCR